MEVRRSAEHAVQAWRNGRGTTREIVAEPSGAWRWRVSVADVTEDDAFSAFPGVERLITVIAGAGMVLDVDGVEHRLDAPGVVLRFDGGAQTACRLVDGPLRDLNLMTRRDALRGELVLRGVAPGDECVLDGPGAAIVIGGTATVGSVLLGRLDAVIADEGERVALVATGIAAAIAVATVRPVSGSSSAPPA